MISDYLLGVLMGDGYFKIKEGYEWYFFSTTHKELADRVKSMLDDNSFSYFAYVREFSEGHEKANYETLEIIEITDSNFKDLLLQNGFKSESVEDRIKINPDFLRGYLETKGTLFRSSSRGNEFWRISFSGSKEEVAYLKNNLEQLLNISFSQVVRRKEREALGIISESYRINLQSRKGVATLLKYIKGEEVTEYLKQRIDGFQHFHTTTPFNMKKKVFKHYKSAVGFMARELNLTIKGVRGGGSSAHKPIYLWDEDVKTLEFRGWEEVYNWISEKYEEETKFKPPVVNSID